MSNHDTDDHPSSTRNGPVSEPEHGLGVAAGVDVPDAVLAPLVAYAAGHATGDPAHFHEAFLPTAHVEGLRDGRFVSWDLAAYCANFTGSPAADESSRRRRIEHVAVTGTVGTATMTLQHGPHTFTDVFLLVCDDGAWRIANKVYHRDRRGVTSAPSVTVT
ncbi:nuclear transport factor 2 family protein [Haloactinopolyspora alba]|nr:nuclear transport factor 2 family protein [Haloactinopolyspora alba]